MGQVTTNALKHQVEAYFGSRHARFDVDELFEVLFDPHMINIWNERDAHAATLNEYLSKNMRVTVAVLAHCCPYHPQYLSPQDTHVDMKKKMNRRFDLLMDLLKGFEIDLGALISPSGRDIWMQIALSSPARRGHLIEKQLHRAVADTCAKTGARFVRREDREMEDLGHYVYLYARYDVTSYIEWMEEQHEVWEELMKACTLTPQAISKNHLFLQKHEAWTTRQDLLKATQSHVDGKQTVDRKHKL